MKLSRIKGTRDYEPKDMILREKTVSTIKSVYEKRGFVPLETPAIEKWETLAGKAGGGAEIEKQTYNFLDFGGRRIGLRYELTVGMVRYLSMNSNISMPFKRYQYGRVWRYEEYKQGRYREFFQFDIDIIGSKSMLADAEVISTAVEALDAIQIGLFTVALNNRKLVEGVLNYLSIKSKKQLEGAMRTIDKIAKLSRTEIYKEFRQYDIEKVQADEILNAITRKGKLKGELKKIRAAQKKKDFPSNKKIEDGLLELESLAGYLESFGVLNACEFDASIVRGLAYYTGIVFETIVTKKKSIGSVCSGGRYDDSIGKITGIDTPAVGISIGIERILDILKETTDSDIKIDYFVAVVSTEFQNEAIKIARGLRNRGFSCEMDLMGRNFSNQMKYANKCGAKNLVIVGPKDFAEGNVTLKDMQTGKETKVLIADIIA